VSQSENQQNESRIVNMPVRFRLKTTLSAQLLLVIIAFLIMVLMGSHFGSRIVSKYIANYGDEVITAMAETIKSYLQGYELTLSDIAFVLEGMKTQGSGADKMQESLALWSDWLHNDEERFSEFLFLYGVVDGAFICSAGWNYPVDSPPQTRVWYTGAYARNGGVYFSDPYIDAYSGEYVLTLSKLLFDQNDQPFGVLALDVYISGISEYISKMQLMDSGYGVLMDSNRRIVVHPVPSLFGVQLESVDGGIGYSELARLLITGEGVSASSFTSVIGVENVAFIKELFNGWYIGLSLPSEVYYNDVVTMRVILSVTGFILALLLCVMLTFIHKAKRRSDTANQVKSSFLANMSHEIRTPMNAVIGMTELLLHENLTERQMEYVNDIISSTHSLLAIINDILDLSKIESGKLTLNVVNYDFHAMVDNINSMFRYVAHKKGVEYRYESMGDLPKILCGDDVRLRQVLTNLCGNAVKYTEKGYVRLKVTVSGGLLIFEVKDTGIGIRAEAMPRLFDAFAQDKSEKNRRIIGTGLGLAISKAFVEMMEGKIMVESEYGQGTVVTVLIPLVLGRESEVRHEHKAKKELTVYAPAARILLVDDNDFNLKVAHGLLGLFGIDAKTVLSGREAIDMLKAGEFDLVFMDHMMPEMDGVEATFEIRKLGGKFKRLPIIALTANTVQGARDMFLANGFNDFIAKPIDMQKLSEILVAWLPKDLFIQKSGAEEFADPDEVVRSSFWKAVNETGEINAEIGINNVSGVEEMYYDNMLLFYNKIIPECERLSNCIKEADIPCFSISIHAFKSVLSTIGAMKLSEVAFKMETASKNRDFIYCVIHFPHFRERMLSLHKTLAAVFPQDEEAAVIDIKPGEPAVLRDNVGKALEAADDFDSDAGIEAMSEALTFDFGQDNNALLEKALAAFRGYDCDSARDALEQIVC